MWKLPTRNWKLNESWRIRWCCKVMIDCTWRHQVLSRQKSHQIDGISKAKGVYVFKFVPKLISKRLRRCRELVEIGNVWGGSLRSEFRPIVTPWLVLKYYLGRVWTAVVREIAVRSKTCRTLIMVDWQSLIFRCVWCVQKPAKEIIFWKKKK